MCRIAGSWRADDQLALEPRGLIGQREAVLVRVEDEEPRRRVGERVVALGLAAVLGHGEVRAVAIGGPAAALAVVVADRGEVARCRAAAGSRRRRTAATAPAGSPRRPCRRCRARSRAPPARSARRHAGADSMPSRVSPYDDERERDLGADRSGAVANSPSQVRAAASRRGSGSGSRASRPSTVASAIRAGVTSLRRAGRPDRRRRAARAHARRAATSR